jgi:hypothetical protein
MKRGLIGWLGAGLLVLSVGCGLTWETVSLEDERVVREAARPQEGLGDFRLTDVFRDAARDAWGLEKDGCKDLRWVTEPTYAGGGALRLEWQPGGCKWTGMGIGWAGWQGKDLRDAMEDGALRFRIRAIEGTTHVPLIIFLLEDYSGVMSSSVFGTHCLERYPLDDQWQEAVLPLSTFNWKQQGCDISNIKQLVLELQGDGAVYIDEMEIVPYVPRVVPGRNDFPPSVAPLFEGITVVFEDYLAHGWGWGDLSSRNFQLEASGGAEGSAALHLQWRPAGEKDRHRRMGMSWTAWRGVDFRSAPEAQLRFLIRSGADTLPVEGLRVGWEGWDGAVTTVPVDFTRLQGSRIDGQWRWVTVPLKDFPFAQDRVDPARIRQLIFEVSPETSGDVWIDQIRIHHEG